MKTMTCKQMGGPCDTKISGNTPDEMITNGEKHLREQKDPAHIKSVEMMEQMMPDKAAMDKWNADFMKTYNALTNN